MIVVTLLTLFCLFGAGPDARGRAVYAKPIPTTDPTKMTTNFNVDTHLGTLPESPLAAKKESEEQELTENSKGLFCSPDNADPSCRSSHDSDSLKQMAQEKLERISKDLEQEKESPAKTFTAKHSNLRSKREAEQEHGDMESEIDDFKVECEKGNEDKATCDSYNEWLSWKEAHESQLNKISNEHPNLRLKREAGQEHGDKESEIDDFKAECEKGNEDKATCDSYNEWLSWKEAHESQLNKISNDHSSLRFKRKAEQGHGEMESEIDDFKAECEKGNEDKATCDSYNEWLSWKEAHESQLNKISNDHSSLRFKRKAEQEHGETESEIDDFKAECEKGNEDKASCDSYNEWLSWKEAHESQLNKISNEQSNLRFKRKAEQEHGHFESEIDDFKAECEEGNEDKATCDSYNEWLSWKEAHESQLNKISNEQSNLRFKRKAEQEHGHMESEIDDVKAECEKGNEDKATCDSYNEWLSWKEAHESQLNKISNEQSNLRFKRKAEQEHGHFESEIDDFKAECGEGNEDKATCDSYNEWLSWKEAHESQLNKISNEQSNLRFKRKAEQEHGDMESEIDDFKAECEKGNEDKATCDSYSEWFAWKEAHESALDKIATEHSNLRLKRLAQPKPGKDYQSSQEISKFKKGCEDGMEDKDTCDSFYNLMKEKEEEKTLSRFIRNVEKARVIEKDDYESNEEIKNFKKDCKEGTESKDICDSLDNLLKEKKKVKILSRFKREETDKVASVKKIHTQPLKGAMKRKRSESVDGFESVLDEANAAAEAVDGATGSNNEPVVRPRREPEKRTNVQKLHQDTENFRRQPRTVTEVLYNMLLQIQGHREAKRTRQK